MGQAPATGRISLRTVPRNFPGRSGTKEDSVYLSSPETAAASALTGVITDPRDLDFPYPLVRTPEKRVVNKEMLQAPKPAEEASHVELEKGPNIISLPELDPLPRQMEVPIILKLGDDISTDEILPAGSRILPFRSNIPKISEFAFEAVDPEYVDRAHASRDLGGHAVVGGENYGQGSSREHAALAPRFLGLRVVLVKGFARIHQQNLVNFGVLPLTFADADDYDRLEQSDILVIEGVPRAITSGQVTLRIEVKGKDQHFEANVDVSKRERKVLLAGGVTKWIQNQRE
jgi:aconitate hydratase